MTDNYGAESIQVLEGLEAVRKRPGMYLGDPHDGTALHHCIWEVVDNSVDEHLAGHTSEIKVYLHEDHSLSVRDFGRGIPVAIHEKYGISAAEVIMTKLHAGGKFDNSSYKVSGGLHGVGVSAVNAVSEWMEVTIHRNQKIYFQRFEAGVPVKALEEIGTSDETGTLIRFKPDLTIFSEIIEFDFETIDSRMKETSFLNAGLSIVILDERGEEIHESTHFYEGGISEFVKQINQRKTALHEDVIQISGSGMSEKGEVSVDLALQWSDAFSESIMCYTNIIRNRDGGTHLSGLRTALTSCVNTYAKRKKLLKSDGLSGEDVREGLAAVVSVKHPDPSFSSQTKDKLVSSEVSGIVQKVVYEKLGEFFEENPSTAKLIVDKALLASKAREAARKARDLRAEKECLRVEVCLESWLIANQEIPLNVRFISLKEILPEVQQKQEEIVEYKQYYRLEEKSSMLKDKGIILSKFSRIKRYKQSFEHWVLVLEMTLSKRERLMLKS